MIRKRKFSKHFDLGHSILFNEFPTDYTRTIGVPGIFVKKINRRVHLKNGAGGEMDSAYIADPDGKLLSERVAVALEHQSAPVGDLKLDKFGDYDIQLVVDEHLPTLMVVASHLDKDKSRNKLVRSPSDITQLFFLDLGKENICQRLSNVKTIINNNQHLSQENALNLGVIVLYAPRECACEITETVVKLYSQISKNLDLKMEYTLYSVLTIMIDAYFDDEDEYRRLISMINDKTSLETKVLFESHKNTIESLLYAKEDLDKVNHDLDKANHDLNEVNHDLDKVNHDLDKVNHDLDKANHDLDKANHDLDKANHDLDKANRDLDEANHDLDEANQRINVLESEVQRLKDKLNGK